MKIRTFCFLALAAAAAEFVGYGLFVEGAADKSAVSFIVNRGVSFGLFPGPVAVCLALGAFGALLLAAWRWAFARPGLSLAAGGAAANLVYRLLRGGVVDWLPTPFGLNLRFNLADVEIVAGLGLLIYNIYRKNLEGDNDHAGRGHQETGLWHDAAAKEWGERPHRPGADQEDGGPFSGGGLHLF